MGSSRSSADRAALLHASDWPRLPMDMSADGHVCRWTCLPMDMSADGHVCRWTCLPMDMSAKERACVREGLSVPATRFWLVVHLAVGRAFV